MESWVVRSKDGNLEGSEADASPVCLVVESSRAFDCQGRCRSDHTLECAPLSWTGSGRGSDRARRVLILELYGATCDRSPNIALHLTVAPAIMSGRK